MKEKQRNKIPLRLIDFYKKNLTQKIPTRCKYNPTCSTYGKECYEKYNFFKASWLTFKHICFCNPFAIGGEYVD